MRAFFTARSRAFHLAAFAALFAVMFGLAAACSDDVQQQQEQPAPPAAAVEQQQQDEQPAPAPADDDEDQDQQDQAVADESDGPALKIGLLSTYTGSLSEFGPVTESAVSLAIKHVNAAGGVWGRPVELVTGDSAAEPNTAVEEARRLIEIEGVHAIVGPLTSGSTIQVTEAVSAASGVPIISPSATSPQLSLIQDNGFTFRSTVSDAAQGPVLAQLAVDEGYTRLGVLFINDAYGQGLHDAFVGAYGGQTVGIGFAQAQASYLAELRAAAEDGGQALVVIAFPVEAQIIIREAVENGFFDRFLFVDGSKSQDLVDAFPNVLDGATGTAPSGGPPSAATEAWEAGYIAEYGELSPLPFVRESYDAALAIALAAERAGSPDGAAIRDALIEIGNPGGARFDANPEGAAAALEAIRDGDDIDLEGSATTLNWDDVGDVTTGYIGVWQYSGGEIVELTTTAIDLAGGFTVVEPRASDPEFTLAFLADYSGAIAEFGPAIETGVRLAVKHVNDAGGVLGSPVRLVVGDTQLNDTAAIEEARRLIEIEGADAIVGPLASGVTLAVSEAVTAPNRIPVISPSATSPQLSIADDDGYLFRSTISDAAQGIVLAALVGDEGFDNVGVIYINNPYGQGLADTFAANFTETATLVAIEDGQTSYLAELQQAAAEGASGLVAVAYPQQAEVFLREAIENDIFTQFVFVDGTKSQDLIDAIGAEYLDRMRGTAPVGGPDTPGIVAWNDAYEAEYGELPTIPFVREAYDAAAALMLAVEAAGTTDGRIIRNTLPRIASPGGDVVIPGADGIARGLELVRDGGDVNYEGAATSLDWNRDGDVTSGWVGIWEFRDGGIIEVDQQQFNLR